MQNNRIQHRMSAVDDVAGIAAKGPKVFPRRSWPFCRNDEHNGGSYRKFNKRWQSVLHLKLAALSHYNKLRAGFFFGAESSEYATIFKKCSNCLLTLALCPLFFATGKHFFVCFFLWLEAFSGFLRPIIREKKSWRCLQNSYNLWNNVNPEHIFIHAPKLLPLHWM